jgi:hypothetical protein
MQKSATKAFSTDAIMLIKSGQVTDEIMALIKKVGYEAIALAAPYY